MSRSIAAVLLVLYAAGSAWVVSREGAMYREGLRREAPRPRPVEIPEPEPEPTPPAPPIDAEPTRPKVSPIITPEPVLPTPPPAPTHPDPPPPVEKPPATVAKPPASDPFQNQPEMKQVWDLSNLKNEDEVKLGQALHRLILGFHEKIVSGPMPRLVEEAAEPFVANRTRKQIDYTFTVLNSEAINAFSHPGGYVYVTSGLINWIGEDQIYALEFVLAHEIAHVDLEHSLNCLKDPGVKELGIGTLPQFLLLIFPRAYAPDQLDFDADLWAYRQMTRLDRSKRECLAFLRKFQGYAEANGFENGRMPPPEPDAKASPIENHYRAHPAPYKRLKQLEKLTTSAPAPAAAPSRPR